MPQDTLPGHAVSSPFSGNSDMAQRMKCHAWDKSPLGSVDQWPHSLKVAVSTLLECQLPMYLAWGPDLVQFYNDAYRPILGHKDEAALGNPASVTWSEIWPTIGPMWQEVLSGKSIGFDDFKLTIERFGYPEDCYFNFSYSPVRDDDGQAIGVLVTFAETTKRVLAERRLRFLDELSQAVRALSDPSEVMRLTATMLGKHLGVNRCAYAHVHADQNTFDLIGDYNNGVSSIVGQYKFTDFGTEVDRLMRAGEPYVNPDVDVHPATAGTELSAYRQTEIQAVICVPLHKKGRFVAAMAVHQSQPRHWTPDEIELVRTVVDRCWDSLERLRTQAALQEEARSLEVLNKTGTILAAELDLEVLLQRVTDAATELTGAQFGAFFYNGQDARGQALMLYTLSGAPREAFEKLGHPRPTAVFGPTFRGAAPIRVDDILTDPRYGREDPHHGMPKGHLPVRSYLAVSVVSRSGEVIGGLFFGHSQPGVFTERSERLAVGIASQAAIAVDNARLYACAQQAAVERELLLESERAARQEAERASTVKDEFLATLSHELRTPLSAITGWVHILRRGIDPSRADLLKGVAVIQRSTKMQVQLIDDLLDMSRITSGKLPLDIQPIAPVSFVQSALDVIRPSAEAAGIDLVSMLEPVEAIEGDAGRLQQVVWNLVANAIKFTPKGGKVCVELRQEQDHAVITVTDTGVGIKPEVLKHIFERFRQADSSITRKFGGLGLGLSIVQNLVELHGGNVTAQSAGEGQGAVFTVRIPLMETAQDQRLNLLRTIPEVSVRGEGSPLLGARVLIVDDDPDARDLLGRILEECGARVHRSEDAASAMEALTQHKPDVVVSDIGMPGMDGFELLRRIRQLPLEAGGATPAIALTAFARPEDRRRALEVGYNAHLTKPIEPASILHELARLLEREKRYPSPT
ncbi:MAG: GAF domain-containing protein [Rubrivivax sp.]|nr:MAG: GAF domain-containing protein [Rubrivivax sp.]